MVDSDRHRCEVATKKYFLLLLVVFTADLSDAPTVTLLIRQFFD